VPYLADEPYLSRRLDADCSFNPRHLVHSRTPRLTAVCSLIISGCKCCRSLALPLQFTVKSWNIQTQAQLSYQTEAQSSAGRDEAGRCTVEPISLGSVFSLVAFEECCDANEFLSKAGADCTNQVAYHHSNSTDLAKQVL
jgi:hypothetical protein